MKRILTIAALSLMLLPARADEGMWLLPLLQKMNESTMQELGCRLSADQIYSINHSSLKDAIVQFGGGCTGEIVSDEGLLLTNHHCGYASIQQLSTVEHDYPDFHLAMDCFVCQLPAGAEPSPHQDVHSELRWLSRDELFDVEWLPADVTLMRSLSYYWDEAFADQLL